MKEKIEGYKGCKEGKLEGRKEGGEVEKREW